MDSEDLVLPGQGRLTFASRDHPPIASSKIGILIGNLGTPDATDYWSMRRYLSEFLSDRRVIDYSPVIWQPLLQLVILSKRPFSSGAAYRGIWNKEKNESPLLTILRNQKIKLEGLLSVPDLSVYWAVYTLTHLARLHLLLPSFWPLS